MQCLICKNRKFKKIQFMNEIAMWNKKKYPLFKCVDCEFTRPFPLPYNDKSKKEIYDSESNIRFYNPKLRKIDFESEEYKDYFKHFSQYADFVIKYNIKGKHIDVGCGAGHIIHLLSKKGLNSEGLEISKKLVNSLKSRYNVYCSELKNIKKKYNLITMSHVFEHVINPNEFVREINKHLYKNGFVILSLPYIKGIIPQLLRTKWYGLGHGQHLNFFSKKNLKILFEENGFKVLEFKIRILDYTHKKFPKLLNSIILLFTKIIEYLNLGDNLYVVAIKKRDLK